VSETLLRLLPVVLGMAVGFLLRRLGVAEHRDGDFVFKLVFYVCLPALMFTSLSTVDVTGRLAIFPATALAAVSAGYLAGRFAAARARLPPTRAAVLVSACMIVNTGFALPFAQAVYGADGVVRIAAFDAVNTTLTFTWAYYTAARGNPEHTGGSLLLDRLLRSPPLYGIAAGLAVNLTGVHVPAALAGPIATFGAVTAVLISIGVGILFEPPGRHIGPAALAVGIRLATGLAVGVPVILIFGLHGVDRTIVLLLAVAPVGFVSVTFASLENLDVRYAVNALSVSMVSSFVLSLAITVATA
jgi:predicted permease